jgi:hypothetical protein
MKRNHLFLWLIVIGVISILFALFLPVLVKGNSSDLIFDFQIGNKQAVINGYPTHLDSIPAAIDLKVAPFVVKGAVYFGIRDMEKLFVASVKWNSSDKTVTVIIPSGIISKIETKLIYTIGSRKVNYNEKIILMDSPAFIQNERCLVPLCSLMQKIGAKETIWITDPLGLRFIFSPF